MGVGRRVRSLEGGLRAVCQRSWSTIIFQTLRTIVPDLRGVRPKEAKTVWRETRGGYHVKAPHYSFMCTDSPVDSTSPGGQVRLYARQYDDDSVKVSS
jgi:hypothetical protein